MTASLHCIASMLGHREVALTQTPLCAAMRRFYNCVVQGLEAQGPHWLEVKTPPVYNWKNGLLAWIATDTGPSATASDRALVSAVTPLSRVTAEPASPIVLWKAA